MLVNPYLNLAVVALLANIPLGILRAYAPKFSAKWFLWIHGSIPLIVYLRLSLEISSWFIPVSIFAVVVGQIWGGRWADKSMTDEEREHLMQVPPKEAKPVHNVNDAEVMVVLLNMGGPKTNADVRDFQLRLFSDDRLIRLPGGKLFQKIFAKMLVKFRSEAVAKRYQMLGGGSPIYPSTEAQVNALQKELERRHCKASVTYSFNYSPPLPQQTIAQTNEAGKKYILPVSLYPHYSSATTGSNLFHLKKAAQEAGSQITFLQSPSYHLNDQYIRALADRIREQVQPNESLDDFYLLFSAHGLPLYFLTEGDPYPFLISQTIAKVLGQLGRDQKWSICYQSAVGPLQWLKPSTEDMLHVLAKRGQKRMIVVPISFVSDHIETTIEIDLEYRDMAEQWGISDFRMSQAIECHPGLINALADTVEQTLRKSIPKEFPHSVVTHATL